MGTNVEDEPAAYVFRLQDGETDFFETSEQTTKIYGVTIHNTVILILTPC
jgi:hypothetical protein